jgi:diguanylate cyclase (GGDEF)-like protein
MTEKAKQKSNEIEALKQENKKLSENNSALNENMLELYTLYNVSRTLSMSLQINELFKLAMEVIEKSLELDQYCLMLEDDKTGKLKIRASHGLPQDIEEQNVIFVENGVSWRVFQSGDAVLIKDVGDEDDFFYYPDSGIERGSFLGVPLIGRDKKVIGVLNAHKPQPNSFEDKDMRLFKGVAEHVATAVENAIAFQQASELSYKDDLTDLFNRRYFFEKLEREAYRSARYQRPLSLLMIDIDHFKRYNDTFGHLRGDEALKTLARIMEGKLRQSDVLARYGGEEFLILLTETRKNCGATVAEKLRAEVELIDFNKDTLDLAKAGLTITIGVAGMPEDAQDAMTLIDMADKAMYFGKAKGRNRVCTEVPAGDVPDEDN